MARPFTHIAFTPNVKAVQTEQGSRNGYSSFEQGELEPAQLGSAEIEFIAERDSLYQGTVGETGWPYVQHRGGPKGFLKVLDGRTLGYADFSGNRQYLSVGNLRGDDRISLFLMDYTQQRRLKIWGRARIVEEDREPGLIARLESPGYRARVERGVVIQIEAFDWNCPQHIAPRYTEAEVKALLRSIPTRPAAADSEVDALGDGPLALVVSGMRQLTPQVRAYELRARDGRALPPAPAGAHIEVPVRRADGSVVKRQYSLTGSASPDETRYEIAVLREAEGRGGSSAVHGAWTLGTAIRIEAPVNHFPLHDDARPATLLAGGIGITPLLSMARALKQRNTPFVLHAIARSPGDLPYHAELNAEFARQTRFHFTRTGGGQRPDLLKLLREAVADSVIYACGPSSLLANVRSCATSLNLAPGRLQLESFV